MDIKNEQIVESMLIDHKSYFKNVKKKKVETVHKQALSNEQINEKERLMFFM